MEHKQEIPIATPSSASPEKPVQQSWHGLLYVCVAVCFFSTTAVFIRWSQPFNSIEIAFWRLALAAILVVVMGLITHTRLLLKRQEVPRFLLYGFTSIAHALAIVYTSPIFVTLLSTIFLREPLARRKYLGIGVAIIGVAIMAGFQPHYTACNLNSTGHCMVLGDGLALFSAICLGVYSVIGRSERDRHPHFR
jgi:drug/metabolite transporter (DMT)-like permease